MGMTAIGLYVDDVVYQVHGRGDSAERDKCKQQWQQVLLVDRLMRQHQRYDQQAILDPLVRSQRLQNDQPLVLSRAVAGIFHRLIHEIAIR